MEKLGTRTIGICRGKPAANSSRRMQSPRATSWYATKFAASRSTRLTDPRPERIKQAVTRSASSPRMSPRGKSSLVDRRRELVMHAIEHHGAERHAERRHLVTQVLRFLQHFLLRARDQHERGLRASQHAVDSLRTLAEPLEEALHACEEVRDLGKHGHAGRFFERAQHEARGAVQESHGRPAGRDVGLDEPPNDLAVEEITQPLRRLEELQGVTRRRRVDDDQVVAATVP